MLLLCPLILYYGRNRYITAPPAGSSVLLTSARAFFYAARGKWSLNPSTLYNNFSSPTFWESVKPSNVRGRRPRWMDFDDAFVDELDLAELGFGRATPADTGRPAYHPAMLLKLYLYGYLNRVPSSRRLEREAQRNLEVLWLTGRLAPDFKTIADFRRDKKVGLEVFFLDKQSQFEPRHDANDRSWIHKTMYEDLLANVSETPLLCPLVSSKTIQKVNSGCCPFSDCGVSPVDHNDMQFAF